MPGLIDHSFLQHRKLVLETEITKLDKKKMVCSESELKIIELAMIKHKGRLAEVIDLIDNILK